MVISPVRDEWRTQPQQWGSERKKDTSFLPSQTRNLRLGMTGNPGNDRGRQMPG